MRSNSAVQIAKQSLKSTLVVFGLGSICILFLIIINYPNLPAREIARGFVLLVIYAVIWAGLNPIYLYMIGRKKAPSLSVGYIIRILAVSLLFLLLLAWIGGHLILFIYPDFNVLHPRHYLTMVSYGMLLGVPLTLYAVTRKLWENALRKIREKELAGERLERELLAARLQALQSQTNPHFLCNALNSIATLIATDPVAAEAAVERLAGLFRYAADSHDGRLTPLADEIRVIEDYLGIEKIRFEERLQLQIAVDPSLLKCLVPPLLFQPLLENAIKHGVSKREDPTTVDIKVETAAGDTVRFIVRNQGLPPAPEKSWQGVGLRNVQSRCRTLFGDAFSFRLYEISPGWIQAELLIPRADSGKAVAGIPSEGEKV
jgi:two-component system LytT family sensor kinase